MTCVPVQEPPTHTYESHLFVPVHAVGGESGTVVGFEHIPVVVTHEPAMWHASAAPGQLLGFEPAQTPAWHAYVCKHLFACVASEHGVPHTPQFALSTCRLMQAADAPLPQRCKGLAQLPTQLVPEQVTVPFAGLGGHAAQFPLHCSVPTGQFEQTPPLQLLPVGQMLPHVPQFFLSVAVLVSQPVPGFLSQSAMGALHMGVPHLPFTHPSTPPVMLQGSPHPPQLATLVSVLTSQPFAGFLSQSA